MSTKTGYVNGSDMLLMIGEKAIGHCTTHNVSISAETKDRAVKPPMADALTTALFKEKGITGLSVSISCEGLHYYGEGENGLAALMALAAAATPVTVKCFERSNDTKPYLSGSFVITKCDHTMPANDDVTYSLDLENTGAVSFDGTGLTTNAAG